MLRLTGTVEAVRAAAAVVPRLAGQTAGTLVVTYLIPPGRQVAPGDTLVEFDPQEQVRNAFDRRAEVADLDGQILKKRADQAIARAADERAFAEAEHDLARAKLEVLKREFVSPMQAEKNDLGVEQATAKVTQLGAARELKQKAAEADLAILQIRRDRSERAFLHAQENIGLMRLRADFAGVAVLKSIYKGNSFGEVVEGDSVRPGQPVLDVIDPTAMRVRARINQADINLVHQGDPATVRLDAYPELSFPGRIEMIAPLATVSSLTDAVRTFDAIISIQGSHPRLMPDLTASVDIQAAAAPLRTTAMNGRP
jgi:multidrug resistance efflux pump